MNDIVAMTLDELQGYEVVIERGKQAFIEVGEALAEIKCRKGYKLQYGTFEQYCQQRWGFSSSYARKQIKSAETVRLIKEKTDNCPQNLTEGQLRPITALPQDQQIAFVETHDISVMTAKEITQAVKGEPEETPAPSSIGEMTREAVEKLCYDLMTELEGVVEENRVLREENARFHKYDDPFSVDDVRGGRE